MTGGRSGGSAPTTGTALAALALCLALALAGCGNPIDGGGELAVDPVPTDRALVANATQTAESVTARRVLDAAVDDGSATVARESDGDVLLFDGEPVVHDGAVYRPTRTRVGERTVERATVEVADRGRAADLPPDARRFSALPPADRRVLGRALHADAGRVIDPLVFGNYADGEDSVLLGAGNVTVVYRGRAVAVEATSGGTETVAVVRYTADRVAPNRSAYAGRLRREYGVVLSGLNDSERRVLRRAIRLGVYVADERGDHGFRRITNRLLNHTAVPGHRDPTERGYVVRWRGAYYWVELYAGTYEPTAGRGERRLVTPRPVRRR